jgi:PAS domain S-box-containing protein
MNQSIPHRNRILSGLRSDEFVRMQPHCERVDLAAGSVLLEASQPITHVYFPETAVVSLRSSGSALRAPQIAMVGSEGLVGLSVFLGVPQPFERAVVLSGGTAVRMAATAFAATLGGSAAAEALVRRFAQTQLELIARSSACVGKHDIAQRCAREMLMLHDRVEGDELLLTHLVLSEVLGVRRPSATVAAESLRAAGAIEYARKRIRIVDRSRLEELACPCYAELRTVNDRLLAIPGPTAGTNGHIRHAAPPILSFGRISAATLDAFEARTKDAKQRAERWSHRDTTAPLTGGEYAELVAEMTETIARLEEAEAELRSQIEALEELNYASELRAIANRSLIDGLPDAFLETDIDGVITDLNWAAEKLLGRARHRALGKPLPLLVDAADRHSIRQFLNRAMGSAGRWEGRLIREAGESTELISVQCTAAPMSAPGHDRSRIRWVVRATQ